MSNTLTLKYTDVGQGLPVVLLHGFPLSSAIWQPQQQLSDRFRVITPDLRGHGKTPAPPGVYDMDLLARDVLALLDSLNISQAAIFGHSMGGYVTLAAWKLAPKRFLALGLVDSQAGADSEEARKGRLQTADKVAASGSQVVADAMLPKLFSPQLEKDDSIVDDVRQIMLATSKDGIIGTLKGMAARSDSTPILSGITVPTLILTGDQDQIIPLEKAQAATIPGATLSIVEDAGHMPMLERPGATTAAIRGFLNELPR